MQHAMWIPGRILLHVFGHLKITGREHLRGLSGPIIFAGNHMSELDGILILAAFGPFSRLTPLIYVSREKSFYKQTLFKKFLFLGGGAIFKALGAYPAIVGLKDYSKSLKVHEDILRRGNSICIFPEGKIISANEERPVKGGVGYLIHSTRATVVPFRVSGVHDLGWKTFFCGSLKMRVDVLPPLSAENLIDKDTPPSPETYKNISRRLLKVIYSAKPM
jgi:long-chain acyl-CoA synthetase